MDKIFYDNEKFQQDLGKFFNVNDLYNADESAISGICSLKNIHLQILPSQVINHQIEEPFLQTFWGLKLFKEKVFKNTYSIITGAGSNDKTICVNVSKEDRGKDIIYKLIFRQIKNKESSIFMLRKLFELVPEMKKLKICNITLKNNKGLYKYLKEITADKIKYLKDDFYILNDELVFINTISISDYSINDTK